jgi:hypothetical protein
LPPRLEAVAARFWHRRARPVARPPPLAGLVLEPTNRPAPPPPTTLPPGELQEPSKRVVARTIEAQDQLVEHAKDGEGLGDGEGTTRV